MPVNPAANLHEIAKLHSGSQHWLVLSPHPYLYIKKKPGCVDAWSHVRCLVAASFMTKSKHGRVVVYFRHHPWQQLSINRLTCICMRCVKTTTNPFLRRSLLLTWSVNVRRACTQEREWNAVCCFLTFLRGQPQQQSVLKIRARDSHVRKWLSSHLHSCVPFHSGDCNPSCTKS